MTSIGSNRIIRLPQDVVNKIAAGEVVVRPVNAVKELIENSLDSGATEIVVSISNGGLDMIKVQDNGHGILREDLSIVCCRYTTSKLKTYEDLRQIHTYGFRGEALASLSYVANLTIITRTSEEICANKASYKDGKITGKIQQLAGLKGTIILAEKLFHSTPSRLAVFQHPHEEANRIVDLLIRYAIHYPNVSFAYRRLDKTGCDFRTTGNANQHNTIRMLLHEKATKQLIDLEFEDTKLHFKAKACLCTPAAMFTSRAVQARHDKLKVFHLFINGRSVECPRLQRLFDAVFSSKDALCPFITLSLEIVPDRIDVNIHPTKAIVHFLNEDQIFERIEQEMHKILIENRTRETVNSHSFINNLNQNMTLEKQDQIRGVKRKIMKYEPLAAAQAGTSTSIAATSRYAFEPSIKKTKVAPKDKIHVDFTNRSMDEFVLTKEDMRRRPTSQVRLIPLMDVTTEEEKIAEGKADNPINLDNEDMEKQGTAATQHEITNNLQISKCTPRMFEFESLVGLRKEICRTADKEAVEIFKRHLLLGFSGTRYAFIQSSTNLYMIRNNFVLYEFFYQLIIFSFGNIGAFDLIQSDRSMKFLPLTELLHLYLQNMENNDENKLDAIEMKQKIDQLSDVLIQNRNMLWNYFSIKIRVKDNGQHSALLAAIPCLIHGYVPELGRLPSLLFQLAQVDYTNEKNCYSGIASALAKFHLPFMDADNDTHDTIGDRLTRHSKGSHEVVDQSRADADERRTMRRSAQRQLRALVFPALRNRFLPSRTLREHIKLLISTAQAFKHFHRC